LSNPEQWSFWYCIKGFGLYAYGFYFHLLNHFVQLFFQRYVSQSIFSMLCFCFENRLISCEINISSTAQELPRKHTQGGNPDQIDTFLISTTLPMSGTRDCHWHQGREMQSRSTSEFDATGSNHRKTDFVDSVLLGGTSSFVGTEGSSISCPLASQGIKIPALILCSFNLVSISINS
jgi:hypothetical protein